MAEPEEVQSAEEELERQKEEALIQRVHPPAQQSGEPQRENQEGAPVTSETPNRATSRTAEPDGVTNPGQ